MSFKSSIAAAPSFMACFSSARRSSQANGGISGGGGVTDLLEDPFNKTVTPPPGHIPPDTWQELREWAAAAVKDGLDAITALKDLVIAGFGPDVWAALGVAA